MDDVSKIKAKLDAAANLISAKDRAIIDELWSDGFRLVGSEDEEIAATREELDGFITLIFAQRFQLRWDWDDISVNVEDEFAWAFARGHVRFVGDPTLRVPYRLVAIFRRAGDGWQWRLYSGSEPEPLRDWAQ